MHIMLCLGGVKICLDCEKEIQIEDVFLPFIIRERSGISGQDEKWKETEKIVEQAVGLSPDRLADAYTDLTADLAFAQTHFPTSRIVLR